MSAKEQLLEMVEKLKNENTPNLESITHPTIEQLLEKINYINVTVALNTQSILLLNRNIENCEEKIKKLEDENLTFKNLITKYNNKNLNQHEDDNDNSNNNNERIVYNEKN